MRLTQGYVRMLPEVPLAERLRRPVAEWQGLVTNDFEEHIFAAHPAIREARDSLLAAGAVYASMSGSGSAVFGLFDDAQKQGNLRLQTPLSIRCSVSGVNCSAIPVLPPLPHLGFSLIPGCMPV